MKSIDELAANLSFTTAKTGESRSVTFLPDPPRARRRYTLISVDDHIVEPAHVHRTSAAQVRRPRPESRRHRRRRADVGLLVEATKQLYRLVGARRARRTLEELAPALPALAPRPYGSSRS